MRKQARNLISAFLSIFRLVILQLQYSILQRRKIERTSVHLFAKQGNSDTSNQRDQFVCLERKADGCGE